MLDKASNHINTAIVFLPYFLRKILKGDLTVSWPGSFWPWISSITFWWSPRNLNKAYPMIPVTELDSSKMNSWWTYFGLRNEQLFEIRKDAFNNTHRSSESPNSFDPVSGGIMNSPNPTDVQWRDCSRGLCED